MRRVVSEKKAGSLSRNDAAPYKRRNRGNKAIFTRIIDLIGSEYLGKCAVVFYSSLTRLKAARTIASYVLCLGSFNNNYVA